MKVVDFLKEKQVDFDVIPHRRVFDAQRLAGEIHQSGHDVAKTVLLRARNDDSTNCFVAVLPASRNVDLDRARETLKVDKLELATEIEMKELCPDCEMGALPPFGSQYGMPTVVDSSLSDEEEIVFEGNTHEEAIRMNFADFNEIEHPIAFDFASRAV